LSFMSLSLAFHGSTGGGESGFPIDQHGKAFDQLHRQGATERAPSHKLAP